MGHNPDMNMKIKTESPRLAFTPGEWYASDLLATTSTGFRHIQCDRHGESRFQNSVGFSPD